MKALMVLAVLLVVDLEELVVLVEAMVMLAILLLTMQEVLVLMVVPAAEVELTDPPMEMVEMVVKVP